MPVRTIIKLCVDALLTAALMLLMSYSMIGTLTHEIIGVSMFALFIVHHILNLNWHKRLFKGRYTVFRAVQTVFAVLILCTMLGSVISGIMLSRHIFRFLNITAGVSFARTIHLICAYWGFVLMSIHLGFHWQMMIGMTKKLFKTRSKTREWAVRLAGFAAAGYGIYAMITRGFVDYLLLVNRFAFFDPNENIFLFVLDYIAISAAFVLAGHYFARAMHSGGRKAKQERDREYN